MTVGHFLASGLCSSVDPKRRVSDWDPHQFELQDPDPDPGG
jgi:hypothetical protein